MGICLFLTLVGMDLEVQPKYDVDYSFQINNLSMENWRTGGWIIESVSSLPQSAEPGLHPESGVPPQLLCL